MERVALFLNRTTNGDGTEVVIPTEDVGHFSERTLHLSGVFDGATFSLIASDGTTYAVVTDAVYTVAVIKNIGIRAFGMKGRLAGAGANTSITAYLI